MVDRYYRKIEDVENDIENAMQISSILLKLKGYDEKLGDLSKIDTNENNISSNLSKIGDNENSISSNLSKIGDNESNISSNLSKIGDNENSISSNLSKIGDNESNISSNLSKIEDNENNISSNLSKIEDNENNISSNLSKIEDNENSINEINENLSNIDFNSNNKYSIENFFIYNIEIENSYKIYKDKRSFSIFKYTSEDDFKKNSVLEIDCRLLYQYTNYNNIGLLQHIFKLYDDNDNMFYNYKSLKTNAGDNKSNDLKQNDMFYVELDDDYKIIKIELILSLIDSVNNTVDCKIYNTYNSNFLSIKYYKKINLISVNNNLGDLENTILSNSSKIDINKNNISTNLINISTNEDNIASNLSEIDYLKKNKSTQYLKNIYNILIYDLKTQIDFRKDIFFEKVFDVNSNKNDFIEIFFKIELEYQDTDDQHYVKSIYEILDENDNTLYIKSVTNNEYLYFSNKLIIDENIFYNFTNIVKKMKFVIKFQKLSSTRVIKIWYIKNDNYRLIIKIMDCKKYFLYIIYRMSDLENGYKINRYFYMDADQKISKYKRYCIISDCEKNASFYYKDLKDPIYCHKHKL